MYPDNIDSAAIDLELAAFPSDWDRKIENTEFALDNFGSPYDVAGSREQRDRGKFWDCDLSYDAFVAWASQPTSPEMRPYRDPLNNALKCIDTRNLPDVPREFHGSV